MRGQFAELLGVPVEQIALTTSTSEGCNVVLNGLGLGAGDEIVTTDAEHFGVVGPLAVSPATVRIARVRDRPADDAYETILAEVGPRTKLIALSHVLWITGHRLPWRERAGDRCAGAGRRGAVRGRDPGRRDRRTSTPSPRRSGCAVGHDRRARGARPRLAASDAAELPLPARVRPRERDVRAARGLPAFDTHFTPLASTAGLLAAFDLHPEWRFERAAEISARGRDLLAERVEVVTEPGHANLISFRADDPEETVARLAEAGVIVRDLPGTGLVRVSCGWWTSDEDLDRLIGAL